MVVHDEARVQAWVQTREKKREKNQPHAPLHLSVVAVQSIACCVAVLIVLLFRMAGGEAYQSLRRRFQQGLARNEWVSSVAQMWDGDPIEKAKEEVKQETFTDEEVHSLLNAFDFSTYLSARNKLILAIAFDTGARNTEICDILEEDARDNVILIHGKGNKERHVPVTPYLKKLLFKYQRIKSVYFANQNLQYGNLLLSRMGRPLTKEALEHVFTQAAQYADVRERM